MLMPEVGVVLVCAAAGAVCLGRLAGIRPLRAARGAFSAQEAACTARLTSLRRHAEQVEQTLRDLRSLSLRPPEAIRAAWAEMELDEDLRHTRRAIAAERAGLRHLEVARWLLDFEAALTDLPASPARLEELQTHGTALRQRLEADPEAIATRAGAAACALLHAGLRELNGLRDRGFSGDHGTATASLCSLFEQAHALRDARPWADEPQ